MKKFYFCIIIFILSFSFFMCKSTNDNVKSDNNNNTNNNQTTNKVEKIDQRLVFTINDKEANNDDFLKTHMKDLFNAIEEKIASGDYEAWYSSISKNYKDYINNQAELTRMSEESDSLINRGIKLKTSKDYFEYVVMQAREKKVVKFYGYQYIDKFHLKVICMLDGRTKFVYNFIYEDNFWKLDR